jgi:hypothetical protein
MRKLVFCLIFLIMNVFSSSVDPLTGRTKIESVIDAACRSKPMGWIQHALRGDGNTLVGFMPEMSLDCKDQVRRVAQKLGFDDSNIVYKRVPTTEREIAHGLTEDQKDKIAMRRSYVEGYKHTAAAATSGHMVLDEQNYRLVSEECRKKIIMHEYAHLIHNDDAAKNVALAGGMIVLPAVVSKFLVKFAPNHRKKIIAGSFLTVGNGAIHCAITYVKPFFERRADTFALHNMSSDEIEAVARNSEEKNMDRASHLGYLTVKEIRAIAQRKREQEVRK